MILLGNSEENLKWFFSCKEYSCLLTDRFNIILYAEQTAYYKNKAHQVGYVVPIDYLSFIKTMNRKNEIGTPLREIFKFPDQETKQKLEEYVNGLGKDNLRFRILKELVVPKNSQKFNAVKDS